MNNHRKFVFFDLLRFAGAFIVMSYHVPPINSSIYNNMPLFFKDGYLWVFFYIMISGFLSAYFNKNKQIKTLPFMKQKIIKIYPVYFLSLLLVFLSIGKQLSLVEYITPVLMIQTWLVRYMPFSDPGWYISSLMFFYLTFPLMKKYYQRNQKMFLVISFVVVIYSAFLINKFMNIYVGYDYNIKTLYYLSHFFPPLLIGVFMTGICIQLLGECLPKSQYYSWMIVIYIVIVSLILNSRSYITSIAVFIPIIVFTYRDEGFLTNVFANNTILYLSNLSFYVYILHMPIIYILKRIIGDFTKINRGVITYYILVLLASALVKMIDEELFKKKLELAKKSNEFEEVYN